MKHAPFSNVDAFWEAAANAVEKAVNVPQKTIRIAASGGSSATIFDVALKRDMPFENWEVYQTDERYVDPQHEDANALLLNKKLEQKKISFVPFDTSLQPEESAKDYAQKLQTILQHQDFLFDLTVLGIGPDGHTASLFPASPALDETKQLTAVTHTDIFAIPTRLTLTYPALQKSKTILVLLSGKAKKDMWELLQNTSVDYHQYPGAKILDWPQTQMFFLDA